VAVERYSFIENPLSPSRKRSRKARTCASRPISAPPRMPHRAPRQGGRSPSPPPSRLVPRPVDERLDLRPFPYVERPIPFGAYTLCPATERSPRPVHRRRWKPSRRLRRVRVERDACPPGRSGDLRDRSMVPTSLFACITVMRIVSGVRTLRTRPDRPSRTGRPAGGHLRPEFFQNGRGDRGRVFDGGGDDMVPTVPVGEEDP